MEQIFPTIHTFLFVEPFALFSGTGAGGSVCPKTKTFRPVNSSRLDDYYHHTQRWMPTGTDMLYYHLTFLLAFLFVFSLRLVSTALMIKSPGVMGDDDENKKMLFFLRKNKNDACLKRVGFN
jgi:hypothetical protein